MTDPTSELLAVADKLGSWDSIDHRECQPEDMVDALECMKDCAARIRAAISPEREAFVAAAMALGTQVADSGWHLGAPTVERFMETYHAAQAKRDQK
jgi:hypothetical protein